MLFLTLFILSVNSSIYSSLVVGDICFHQMLVKSSISYFSLVTTKIVRLTNHVFVNKNTWTMLRTWLSSTLVVSSACNYGIASSFADYLLPTDALYIISSINYIYLWIVRKTIWKHVQLCFYLHYLISQFLDRSRDWFVRVAGAAYDLSRYWILIYDFGRSPIHV